jgi:uncharacterized membrane protein YqjE
MRDDLDSAVRASNPAEGGLLARARRFTGALLEHVATRGELLAVEIAEEKQRLVQALVAAAILVTGALTGLVFLGVLALVLAWDTSYRTAVAVVIPVVFIAVAVGALFWLKSLVSKKTALFRDSLRELREDAQSLRS